MPTKAALRDSLLADRSDDDLVELARRTGNDDGAFEELYRRHESGARSVARHILRSRHDADDVVSDAFAGVISAISNGAGPRSNFRQYLMACVRNSCKSRRWCGRSISTDPSLLEREGAIFEDPERLSEAGVVANAFSSLSPDWQQTLWMTAVEQRPTAEIAEQLGRRPAAVAALAHRAREAFAEAYLAQHQLRATGPACARISPKLAHYVRGRAGDVDVILVERHLVDCVACSCAVEEMRDLNASLRTLTGPAPLVGVGLGAVGAATMVGFLPMTTAGGWSVGALSGAAVAKIAVLGALLVPAAIVAASASPSNPAGESGASATTTAAGGRSGANNNASDDPAGNQAAETSETPIIVDPLLADVVIDVPASPTSGSGSGSDSTDGATGSSAAVILPPGASVPPSSNPPIQVGVTLPAGGTATVAASPTGITVGVTIPVVTLPINVEIPVPSIAVPGVEIPVITLPPITTPPISTPTITVPGVSIPAAGLPLPPLSTPDIVIPSVVLPSLTLPAISVPPVSLPPVTVPPVSVVPVTIPDVVGSILIPVTPLTLPKLGG
jgi:RNA polymerase sigma factor (sigma-70 family)